MNKPKQYLDNNLSNGLRKQFKNKVGRKNYIKVSKRVARMRLTSEELALYCVLLMIDKFPNFQANLTIKKEYANIITDGAFYRLLHRLKDKGLILPNNKPNPSYLVNSMRWACDQKREKDRDYFIVSIDALKDKTMPIKVKGLYCYLSFLIPLETTVIRGSYVQYLTHISKNSLTKYYRWLEDHNYLIREKSIDDNKLYEYKLFDKPYSKDGSFDDEVSYIETNNSMNYKARLESLAFYQGKSLSQTKKDLYRYRNIKSIYIGKEEKAVDNIFIATEKSLFRKAESFIGKGISMLNKEIISTLKEVISKLNSFSLFKIINSTKLEATMLYLKVVEIMKNDKVKNKEGYIFSLIKDVKFGKINLDDNIKKDYLSNNMKFKIEVSKLSDINDLKFVRRKFCIYA